MSTKYTPPAPADQPPAAPAEPVAKALPVDRTSAVNAALVRKVPAAAFTVALGTAVIGVVAGAVVAANHVVSAEPAPADVGKPLRPAGPPPADAQNVDASVRGYLIADAASTPTSTGVTLTGTMTEVAESDPTEFSGHVSRLLEQNCVDNMSVVTQDNLRISAWGYCFNSPGAEEIYTYVTEALGSGADELNFRFYPGNPLANEVQVIWSKDSPAAADAVVDTWDEFEPVGRTDKVIVTAYDPERARFEEKFGAGHDTPDRSGESPRS